MSRTTSLRGVGEAVGLLRSHWELGGSARLAKEYERAPVPMADGGHQSQAILLRSLRIW